MNQSLQLLFCDTFEHKNWNDEDVNIDLVKFSSQPVVVREVRIIPDGTNVSLESGGYTRGYTMPRSFTLEIFANNLGRSAACTFEKVGTFEYRHDKETKFAFSSYIATDGLLIRGKYKFVSVALLGNIVPVESQSENVATPVTASQAQMHQIFQTPVVASPCTSTPQLTAAAVAAATPTGVVASPAISPPGIQSVVAAIPQQVYQPPAASTSTAAVMNLAHAQSIAIPQTQTLTGVPVAPWPAPALQILSGVAAFNPLVPPPHQLSAYPSMGGLQPPGVSGPSPYSTFDLSRPPPQAPPGVTLPHTGDISGVVAPPRRKRARSRSSSSSRRRHHHRRRRSTSGGGTDSSAKKRKRSSPSSSNTTTTARRSSHDRSSNSRSRRATATSTSSSTAAATTTTKTTTRSPASGSSHRRMNGSSQSSKRSSAAATRKSPAAASNVTSTEQRSTSLAPEINLEDGGKA